MNYELLTERLMQHFSKPPYEQEVQDAKQEFFRWAGIFDEETPDFEMKMAQFVESYLFSRDLSDEGRPPIAVAMDNKGFVVPENEHAYYRNLADNRHSLFEFLKLKGEDVHIRDLFSGYKMIIQKSPVTLGFERNQIFEARLIPHEDNFIFGSAFCFHPPQATKFIQKEIKKVKKMNEADQPKAREELMLRLFKMRYKHEQYRHVGLEEVYSNDSKMRL